MLIVYHENNEVSSVYDLDNESIIVIKSKKLVKCLKELSSAFDDKLIIWCHVSQKDNLALDLFPEIFHHQKIMASFNGGLNYLPESIGYVEDSVFVNVNKLKRYPTWQMSSTIGGVFSSVLRTLGTENFTEKSFDYFLLSIAKQLMKEGLQVYSEPRLLLANSKDYCLKQAKITTLFKFVRQHYKPVWVFLLFANFIFYEKKVHFFPLINSFFFKRKRVTLSLKNIENKKNANKNYSPHVDVIIPTIGRKKYLYDFLTDLSNQTYLPKNVIIIEQNPDTSSTSDLDYLNSNNWPFLIKKTFTHQAGACNARNLALNQVESEWVFFADDDIRIDAFFLQNAIIKTQEIKNEIFTFNCKQRGEKTIYHDVFQWSTFGSGCSFVNTKALKGVQFDKGFEFSFGEDADFGMQLRQKGFDILYLPQPEILHLKAPIGGFRTKPILPWNNDEILPKPSPTILLYFFKHLSFKQLLGYKTILFIKYYKLQRIKNPFAYYQNFQKQWERSMYWANQLKIQN